MNLLEEVTMTRLDAVVNVTNTFDSGSLCNDKPKYPMDPSRIISCELPVCKDNNDPSVTTMPIESSSSNVMLMLVCTSEKYISGDIDDIMSWHDVSPSTILSLILKSCSVCTVAYDTFVNNNQDDDKYCLGQKSAVTVTLTDSDGALFKEKLNMIGGLPST